MKGRDILVLPFLTGAAPPGATLGLNGADDGVTTPAARLPIPTVHNELVLEPAAEAVSVADNADTERRKRVRGAKIVTVSGREQFVRPRRLRLARRYRVADRPIPKIVPRALRNRKEVS